MSSKPQVTITLGCSGQRVVKNSRSDSRANYQAESGRKRSVSDRFEKDDDRFMSSSNKRLQRTDYPRSAESSTIGKGARIGKNDLRLKLLRKRTTRQVKHEVQEHTKREIRHISSSAMVPKVTEQTFMPSTMPRIIRRRSNNDVLAPSIPIHSMPVSGGANFDTDKQSTGHLSGGQCLTVSSLLNSLGLGKYAINFQAEEVDMTVMKQMRDQDLKELGLPMGPRKKILLAIMPRPKRQPQLQA